MTQELRKDALGILHSVAMGVAGSAPSYSISATLSTLIVTVGILAPASLLYCGLIMLGIVFAYQHLSARDPNAGASYAWGSAIIGKVPGFLAGWALLVASVIFMVSSTIPAGQATVMLVAPDYAESQIAATACAAMWLLLVTFIVVRGISLTGWIQSVMTTTELTIMGVITLVAMVKLGPTALERFTWHDFSPLAFSPSEFAAGAVISLFFFWGWDVALNLSEETREPGRAPGLGAVMANLILIVAFAVFAVICLLALDEEEIKRSVTSIVFAAAEKLFPRPWSYLAVLALMLSTIGTIQTQMLQFSRTLFAQARDRTLDPRWAKLHDSWQTPVAATLLISGLGLLLLFASLSSASIAEVMKQSINAIGVLAAYYYGLAGLACAVQYRGALRGDPIGALVKVIWPAASALALFWAGALTAADFDRTTAIIAVGSMVLAAIPLLLRRRKVLAA